jgi:hypothetical protein
MWRVPGSLFSLAHGAVDGVGRDDVKFFGKVVGRDWQQLARQARSM